MSRPGDRIGLGKGKIWRNLPLLIKWAGFGWLGLGSILGTGLVWGLLGATLSRITLAIALVISVIQLARHRLAFVLLFNVILVLLVVDYRVSLGTWSPLAATLSMFLFVLATGLAFDQQDRSNKTENNSANEGEKPRAYQIWQELKNSRLVGWTLAGFLLAQLNSILLYYPISFLEQGLLAAVSFYFFWHWLEYARSSRPEGGLLGHFIYGAIAVILVVGIILWTNLPRLGIF